MDHPMRRFKRELIRTIQLIPITPSNCALIIAAILTIISWGYSLYSALQTFGVDETDIPRNPITPISTNTIATYPLTERISTILQSYGRVIQLSGNLVPGTLSLPHPLIASFWRNDSSTQRQLTPLFYSSLLETARVGSESLCGHLEFVYNHHNTVEVPEWLLQAKEDLRKVCDNVLASIDDTIRISYDLNSLAGSIYSDIKNSGFYLAGILDEAHIYAVKGRNEAQEKDRLSDATGDETLDSKFTDRPGYPNASANKSTWDVWALNATFHAFFNHDVTKQPTEELFKVALQFESSVRTLEVDIADAINSSRLWLGGATSRDVLGMSLFHSWPWGHMHSEEVELDEWRHRVHRDANKLERLLKLLRYLPTAASFGQILSRAAHVAHTRWIRFEEELLSIVNTSGGISYEFQEDLGELANEVNDGVTALETVSIWPNRYIRDSEFDEIMEKN